MLEDPHMKLRQRTLRRWFSKLAGSLASTTGATCSTPLYPCTLAHVPTLHSSNLCSLFMRPPLVWLPRPFEKGLLEPFCVLVFVFLQFLQHAMKRFLCGISFIFQCSVHAGGLIRNWLLEKGGS